MMHVVATAALVAVLTAVHVRAQDGKAAIDAAAAALGATSLRSIQYSGWGSDYVFGQGYDGSSPWPRFTIPAMTVAIDYEAPAFRDDRRRAQAENPPLGGGFQPMVGEQRQIEADSYMPTSSLTEAPGGVANLAHFCQQVERLGLHVEQIIPIHGRLTTLAEARAYVEAFGRTQIFK